MGQESLLELLKGHILCLFLFTLLSFFCLLHLDFVNNIQSAAIVALEISSAQLPYDAVLLNWLEKALANVTDQILLFDLFEVAVDCLLQSLAMLARAEQLLDLGKVVFLTIFLMLFENLNACAAISVPDVLNELCAVTNQFTLNCVHKWARPLIETVRAAYLNKRWISSYLNTRLTC